jgi:hypothetical protein
MRWESYIVFDNLVAALQGCDALVLLVLDPSQGSPFPSTVDERLPETVCFGVIQDGKGVQGGDLDGALERLEIDDSFHATDSDGVGGGLVDEIDALAGELVARSAIAGGAGEGDELVGAPFARDGALCDEDGAGDQDGVEILVFDLAVRDEVPDGGYGRAVVGVQPLEQDVDGGQDVFFLVRLYFLGGDFVAVGCERAEEGEEDLGLELGVDRCG